MIADRSFGKDIDIALVGEIDVRRELAAEGWLTINTNTEKGNFPNVDLIAAMGQQSRAIQVKTTNGEHGLHSHCMYLGRAEGWLTSRTHFFNRKDGPLSASVVVLVNAKRIRSRFVVLPVALAEKMARISVEQWYSVPKKDGKVRSAGFDARLPFTRLKQNSPEVDQFLQTTLMAFEDRWDILNGSIEKLNDEEVWGVKFPMTKHA